VDQEEHLATVTSEGRHEPVRFNTRPLRLEDTPKTTDILVVLWTTVSETSATAVLEYNSFTRHRTPLPAQV